MVLKLHRAKRVRDIFQRVALPVREVVERVDAPRVPGALVAAAANAVEHRVAQIDVVGCHVNFRAQHHFAVGVVAVFHAREKFQVFLHAAFAVAAVDARLGQRAAPGANFLGALPVHIGQALFDQLHREVMQLPEVIGGVRDAAPFKAEPANVLLNRGRVFRVLFFRVGVVKAQRATPAVIARDAEVQADRLGVADVQVAVRLRRKARDHRAEFARGQLGLNLPADEIGFLFGGHDGRAGV